MAQSPDFKKIAPKNPFQVIADLKRPRVMAETGWHIIGSSSGYESGVYLQNSWARVTATGAAIPSFYQGEEGRVRARGKVDGGSVGSTIFTFPEECRPEYAESFILSVDGGGFANVTVQPDGQVILDSIGP